MKKFTKRLIPYLGIISSLSLILISLVFIISFIFESTIEEPLKLLNILIPYLIIGIILIIVGSFAYSYLYYRLSEYEFSDKGIAVRRGILFKKKSYIEYNNIHAVNKKQNILEKIFGISRLMIDSGSANTASMAEIIIYEDNLEVDRLLLALENNNLNTNEAIDNKMERENLFCFTKRLKLFTSLIDSISNIAAIGLIILGLLSIPFILSLLDNSIISIVLVSILLGIVGIYIIGLIGSILRSFVHYYNFRVYRSNDEIEINYGLITSYRHKFKLDRIKAVVVRQPFFYSLFGYCAICLEVIGYSEDNEDKTFNDNYLIPICKLSECDEIINRIIGDFTMVENKEKCKSYFSIFSWKLLWITIGFSIIGAISILIANIYEPKYNVVALLVVLALYLAIVGYLLINSYLQYKFEGIGIDKNRLTIYHGGFYKIRTTILNKYIIGLDSKTTPLRERRNISSFNLHIKSNSISNEYKLEIMDSNLKDNIASVIKY